MVAVVVVVLPTFSKLALVVALAVVVVVLVRTVRPDAAGLAVVVEAVKTAAAGMGALVVVQGGIRLAQHTVDLVEADAHKIRHTPAMALCFFSGLRGIKYEIRTHRK